MPPIASISNLNSRLSATAKAQEASGASGRRSAPAEKHDSVAPVRILGSARRYRGGYLLNV
jgi:hypothetical protein